MGMNDWQKNTIFAGKNNLITNNLKILKENN